MRYILFTKEECNFCSRAVELLLQEQLPFNIINFEPEQEGVLSEMKKAYEWATVPMIFFRNGQDIKFIGGFTDLEKWLINGGKT